MVNSVISSPGKRQEKEEVVQSQRQSNKYDSGEASMQ